MDKPLAANTLNKVFAFGLALTLVAWTFGVYFVLPAQAADVHPNGTLVLSGSTVYKIWNNQRLGFSTAPSFLSNGYSWSQVVPANSADLALPQGDNVKFADGALVNDAGTVYVIANGQKLGFTSAAVFTGLGYKWSNVYTDSLASYPQGANIDSATAAHQPGTLVNSNGTIYQMTSSGRAGIPTMAVFQSWGFDLAKVAPANSADMAVAAGSNLGYRVGTVVNDNGTIFAITDTNTKVGFPTASCFLDNGYSWTMSVVGSTSGYTAGSNLCGSSTTPTEPSSTGNLSVSLASDTPASGVVIKNTARAPFTKVALTATGGDVVVNGWTVKRVGVGQNGAFSSVDIVDLSTNAALNDVGKTFNSDNTAIFSEKLTIPSGTTKYVMLAGNMANVNTYSGETPALSLQSITVAGGSVNGSFPIAGNSMTINTSITLGGANVAMPGAYQNSSTNVEVGKTGYTFLSFPIAATTQDVKFSQVKVYQNGNAILGTDVNNFKLYRDGTVLATGTVSGSYVNFTFSGDIITKGQTAQYQVKGDVVGGSGRNIILGIYRTTDLTAIDQTYNAGITPAFTGTGTQATAPMLLDNTFTISTGTLRVGSSNAVASGNITVASDQVIGAFEMEAKGEPVNVTALTLNFSTSTATALATDALRSVKIVDANGKTVAGPVDPTRYGAHTYAFTGSYSDTFTVPVGVNTYKVVGTLSTSGSWATNDTLAFALNSSSVTARGANTSQSVTGASLTGTASGNVQTIKTAKVTVTKNSTPVSGNVTSNSKAVLAGSWTFDATDSGEDIRITSLGIATRVTAVTDVNNVTLKDGTTALSPVLGNPSATTATSTFAFSDPLIITKGTSKVLNLYVDLASDISGHTEQFGITTSAAVNAYGKASGNTASVTVTANDGASLAVVGSGGALAINIDASAPSSRLVTFGTSGVDMTEVRLKATNEDVAVTKLTVGVMAGGLTGAVAGDYSQLSKVYLKLDGAVVGNADGYAVGSANTTINLGSTDLVVPQGSTGKKLSVLADVVGFGTSLPGTANTTVKAGIAPLGAKNTGSGDIIARGATSGGTTTVNYTDSTGTAVVLHKAVPSVVVVTPTNKLTVNPVLHETKVSAVGGTIGLYRMTYDATTSTGLTLTNGYLKLASCGSCGGIPDGAQLSDTSAAATSFAIDGHTIWSFTTNGSSHGKNFLQIPAGSTATIDFMATIGNQQTASTDSVSVSLLGDTATSTTEAQPAAAFGALKQGDFVWSDLNAEDSNSGGLAAKQWYNGYYVSGLGSTATTTAVTISE